MRVMKFEGATMRDAIGMVECRHPGDRASPIVPDQGEAFEIEPVGQRDHVGDRFVRSVILDTLGLGRSGEAALVRGEDEMVLGKVGDLVPPGAVRLGKTVEQDDRGIGRQARYRYVKLDSRR